MKNLNNYLSLLQAGLNNLKSDDLFYKILQDSEIQLDLNDSQLAGDIQLSVSTISRYRNKIAIPNPIMRKSIYQWLINKTNLTIEKQKGG